jgi:phosphoribosylformylglycinamidine synthase
MNNKIKRIFVEKKPPFDIEAQNLLKDLKESLSINTLQFLRLLNRYDISGISDYEYNQSKYTILSEKTVDRIFEEELLLGEDEYAFSIEYLPGQYDQRADSASECIQLLTQGKRPLVRSAKVIVLNSSIHPKDIERIKSYLINPVDSIEASMLKPSVLETDIDNPADIQVIDKFISLDEASLKRLYESLKLAMTFEDLLFCRDYFHDEERRNPTFTELKVIDTYWSDHCRHTTFLTEIKEVAFEKGKYTKLVEEAYIDYKNSRTYIYGDSLKPICLMDLAVIGMKELHKKGLLDDLDLSDEINACSIKVPIEIDGKTEEWLIMFKNETHNHPTEIEPFGGAATCLGGAIRDPLSGRAYVYQAMRLTGSGDPRVKVEQTLPGKLPQKKITTEASHGYSSYGNQIGLATGFVSETYDEGFVAKRMEVGAVIAATPSENVLRQVPESGDVVILLGGRTGRDGCGGATGSSKEHTEDSIATCGAEVQKGNAPTERKIQRLFRSGKASKMIKRCNDFGAGGVSVAIGELADGLEINLDLIPKKYEGLDGTELAISESQERMAVVVSKEHANEFILYAVEENLEATIVAEINNTNRLVMLWRGKKVVDISRSFLNTNGAKAYTNVFVSEPSEKISYFKVFEETCIDFESRWIGTLRDLNVCCQKGLVERFDSTIGAGTILMPFGGVYQLTPSEGMAAKIPVLNGNTKAATIMTCGYNPQIAKWSPFHGAVFALIEAAARVVALGGDYKKIRLSLQEYFEKLGNDSSKWGKPFSALLGALLVQKELGIAAIGGKDSMSGSFNDLSVPPTLAAFAVCVSEDCSNIISQEFKKTFSKVVLLHSPRTEVDIPDFNKLKRNFEKVHELILDGNILSACSVKSGGICEAISKMSFGNKIGFAFSDDIAANSLFSPDYGSILVEVTDDTDIIEAFEGIDYHILGSTIDKPIIKIDNHKFLIEDLINVWIKPLESIFPLSTSNSPDKIDQVPNNKNKRNLYRSIATKFAQPRVFIPVFPGTNCEYDSSKAFQKAGAVVNTFVFKNLTPSMIEESVKFMEKEIRNAQIIMLPGGFSAGDEPDGSGKFIATVFRNPRLKDSIMELLKNRDGLMLGICNGFQALIKLGLVPYGEIIDIDEATPTLTYNEIGRHVSCMVRTKVTSKLSPWFDKVSLEEIHSVPVSHGEGRFVGREDVIRKLFENGQVATQYVDLQGNPSLSLPYNPNGSFYAIEGITSPDGRILGKMSHSERTGDYLHKNVPGKKEQNIFAAGVCYFR